ncbi:BON domain-containing protein [Paraburkholderia sp. IMGN_8]|uniref:BON domain-containing protein n=1 Tax=Paraburkholderia sp. IMGN_8 TaxID=3136564 RepID=UPI003100ACE4
MKLVKSIQTIVAVLLVATIANTFAQPGNASATPDSQAASAPTAKEQRTANRRLTKAVRQALTHTAGLDSSHIVVLVKHGSIALTGSVPNDDQIQKAIDAAKTVPGVNSVNSQLAVSMSRQ